MEVNDRGFSWHTLALVLTKSTQQPSQGGGYES